MYIISCDSLNIKPAKAMNNEEAMKKFDQTVKAYNKENNLVGDNAYLTCQEMGVKSIDELISNTDCIWCEYINETLDNFE